MEPRWDVIKLMVLVIVVLTVCFVLVNLAYTLWTESNEEIVIFLRKINEIGKEDSSFSDELKGVLALGMIGLIILGVVRILSDGRTGQHPSSRPAVASAPSTSDGD